jgi:hypothetical protein
MGNISLFAEWRTSPRGPAAEPVVDSGLELHTQRRAEAAGTALVPSNTPSSNSSGCRTRPRWARSIPDLANPCSEPAAISGTGAPGTLALVDRTFLVRGANRCDSTIHTYNPDRGVHADDAKGNIFDTLDEAELAG